MADVSSSSGDGDPQIDLEQWPDPAVRYVLTDRGPIVTHQNDAFQETFDGDHIDTSVRECCRRLGIILLDRSVEELCTALSDERGLETTVIAAPDDQGHGESSHTEQLYRLQSVTDGAQRGAGYLVFTPLPSDDGGAVGVDRIASVLSHDLRNPLDVAQARLRAAEESGDAEHFAHVRQAHDRMEQIIQDVLTLARGPEAITTMPSVSVQTVATDAWTTVETATATLQFADNLPTIEADPDRLQRLFENLFRNSIEHGQPEAINASDRTVTISIGQLDDGFFVADDGPGIQEPEQDRVFVPGYSSREHGTGLGLTIVRRIAQAHGWTVDLTTGPAGGAQFEFRGISQVPTEDEPDA